MHAAGVSGADHGSMQNTKRFCRGVFLKCSMLVSLHGNSLVLQNSDLDAPILFPSFGGLVVSDWFGVTKTKWLDQPAQIQAMHADQVLNDGLGPALTQGAVLRGIAGGVCKSHYFNQPSVSVPLGLF